MSRVLKFGMWAAGAVILLFLAALLGGQLLTSVNGNRLAEVDSFMDAYKWLFAFGRVCLFAVLYAMTPRLLQLKGVTDPDDEYHARIVSHFRRNLIAAVLIVEGFYWVFLV